MVYQEARSKIQQQLLAKGVDVGPNSIEDQFEFMVCLSADGSEQLGRMTNTIVFSIKHDLLCEKGLHSPDNVFLLGFIEADETLDAMKLSLPSLQRSIERLTVHGIQIHLQGCIL